MLNSVIYDRIRVNNNLLSSKNPTIVDILDLTFNYPTISCSASTVEIGNATSIISQVSYRNKEKKKALCLPTNYRASKGKYLAQSIECGSRS